MNIFLLDWNTDVCAQYHCDKHVVKMILESTQMLSTVHSKYYSDLAPYLPVHAKHPCTPYVLSIPTDIIRFISANQC